MDANQIKLQCITLLMFIVDIYFKNSITFFLIKNSLLLYNIYFLLNIKVTEEEITKYTPKFDSLLFYHSDSLDYQEIDYIFDIGNYFVNIIMDDSHPILYLFTITKYENRNMLIEKVLTSETALLFNLNDNNKVSIKPFKECILYIDIKPI